MSNLDCAIAGLSYIPNYITAEEEKELITAIDGQPWLSDIKRRVQQYGYRYDYRSSTISQESYLGSLPAWSANLVKNLVGEKRFSEVPDQLIINEYLPGQGIGSHIDCIPCFGPVVASLSLISPATMVFTHAVEKTKLELFLEPRSLLLLTGEARYNWKHGIPDRQTDTVDGSVIERQRRISLTLRTLLKN